MNMRTPDPAVDMSPALAGAPLRIYYVDDSGDGRTVILFAALCLDIATHGEASRDWMRFRDELSRDPRLQIPADAPLHSEALVGARGRHLSQSRSRDRATHRLHCREVIRRGLETIARLPGVGVRAAYRRTSDYARDRPAVFAELLTRIDSELAAERAYGVMVVDGDGSEHALRRAHQVLPTHGPRMLRDPLFLSAQSTPLLQAADLLAYSTYQTIADQENRQFMHGWSRILPWGDGPWAA